MLLARLLTPKRALIALGAILAIGAVIAAYAYVDALSDELVRSQRALASAEIARDAASARADELKREHARLAAAFAALEAKNRRDLAEIATLRARIDNLNLKDAVHADPALAADRLNAVAADLNRLLEHASDFGDDGAAGDHSPAVAGAGGAR